MTTRTNPVPPPLSVTRVLGDTVHVSGQTGAGPDGRIPAAFADEVVAAVENLGSALAAAGSGLDRVVRVGVFLTDAADFAEMNEIYRRCFSEPYPARTTAITGLALPGLRFEIDAVAARG